MGWAWWLFLSASLLFLVLGLTTAPRSQWSSVLYALLGLVGSALVAVLRMGGWERGPLPSAYIMLVWLVVTRGVPVRILQAAADIDSDESPEVVRAAATRLRRAALATTLIGLAVLWIVLPAYFTPQPPPW